VEPAKNKVYFKNMERISEAVEALLDQIFAGAKAAVDLKKTPPAQKEHAYLYSLPAEGLPPNNANAVTIFVR
jgi:hypothetical protein